MPPTTQVSTSTATSRRIAWSWRPTGWDTHRTRRAFEDDRAKDAALLAAGSRVVRFTWRQLRYDPQTVADRLTAILGYCTASASRNSASSESSIE